MGYQPVADNEYWIREALRYPPGGSLDDKKFVSDIRYSLSLFTNEELRAKQKEFACREVKGLAVKYHTIIVLLMQWEWDRRQLLRPALPLRSRTAAQELLRAVETAL